MLSILYFIFKETNLNYLPILTNFENQIFININYFRVKIRKPIHVGKFTLDNTIRYQKVIEGGSVLKAPEFVTRNTLYYTDYVFKRALFLQTGVSFNYFSKYHMNAYDPLLAEFYVQNDRQLYNRAPSPPSAPSQSLCSHWWR